MSGVYDVILCDPPWSYESGTLLTKWSIEEHYKTMPLDDIKAMGPFVDSLAAKDCVLFMWTTAPKLGEAFEVLTAWGWNYRTGAVWYKNGLGMGHYFRCNHEHLLVAIKGHPKTPPDEMLEGSVFELKKGRHSEKPDYFRGLIERYYPAARKIELFAREKVPNWDVWGLEAPSQNTTLF